MNNIFPVVLVILTLITGMLWCLNKFFFDRKDQEYLKIKNFSIKNKSDLVELQQVNLKSNYWLKTLSSVFPIFAIILIFRSFIYEPFQIPSASMMPTLLIGDFILVKKFAYNIKDPLFQKTLIDTGKPKRGDIVVFKYPKNLHFNYIKRVVGLPGDKIHYDSITKKITIYQGCNLSSCPYKKILPITYSDIEPSDFIQTFGYDINQEIKSNFLQVSPKEVKKNGIRLEKRKEIINKMTHYILTIPTVHDQPWTYYQQSGEKVATWVVPFGQYFMMGDNRDNSADSRYWGFVPKENLIGKAIVIWMSFEKQENKWPTGLRLSRIGKIIY